MRTGLLLGSITLSTLLLTATMQRDVAASEDDATAGHAEQNDQDSAAPAAPFAPADVGPPESVWPYEALTPAEQAVIDRGRDVGRWAQTHDAYASAVRERSRDARAEVAQHLLGLDGSLATMGVVP
jgi:hypothetical protein